MSDRSMTSCWLPSARDVLYSCVPIRSMRKLVISKWGFPSRAGILFFDAAICARNDPLLFPTNMSGRSWSHTFWIRSRACCGWGGRSGANTVALPSKYSFRAIAGAHAPDAKKPCRKRILRTILIFNNRYRQYCKPPLRRLGADAVRHPPDSG